MGTEPKNLDVNATQSEPNPEPAPKTFTQEDVNRIVANRVAKYADYEELKEKAGKFDAAEEANKSELQKAQEKAAALQSQVDSMKKAEQVRKIRDEVSQETGVPVSLLTGETKEECVAQASAINEYKGTASGYPQVKDGGEPQLSQKKATRDQFADWLNQSMS